MTIAALLVCILCAAGSGLAQSDTAAPTEIPGGGIITEETPAAEPVEGNLLVNGDFSQGDPVTGLPAEWMRGMWRAEWGVSTLTWDNGVIRVENAVSNDARFVQTVNVEPEKWYRLSGDIKAEGIDDSPGSTGANLSVLGSYAELSSVYDTAGQWRHVDVYIFTYKGQRTAEIAARVGGYSSDTTGVAWFDNLSLTPVETPEPGKPVIVLEPPVTVVKAPAPLSEGGGLWALLPVFAAAALLAWMAFRRAADNTARRAAALGLILAAAAGLRVWLAATVKGYGVDINCFHAWALRMAQVGPQGFYGTGAEGYFCDYPPGYLYFLWPIGLLISALGVTDSSAGLQLLVKIGPILADMCIILFLWRIGESFSSKQRDGVFHMGIPLALLYAFNPAALIIGSAWGQIDAALALGLALTLWRASKNDYRSALPLYLLTVLMKPQALLVGPLGLFALVIHLSRCKWDKNEILRALAGLALGLALCFALLLPFCVKIGWGWLPGKYFGTMGSYDYATVNAANLYFLMGGNWVATSSAFLGALTYREFALLLMILVLIGTLWLYWRAKDTKAIFLAAALTFLGFFLFSFRMHERYLFPALAFFLAAYAVHRDGRLLWIAVGLSVTLFFNVWYVLLDEHLTRFAAGCVIAAFNLALGAFAGWTGWELCARQRVRAFGFDTDTAARRASVVATVRTGGTISSPVDLEARMLSKSNARLSLKSRDWLLMLGLTLAYAVVAYWGLGDSAAPQTFYRTSGMDETITFDLGETRTFSIMYYNGISSGEMYWSVSEDGETWSDPMIAPSKGECFRWVYNLQTFLNNVGEVSYMTSPAWHTARYARLAPEIPGLMLGEVVFRTEDGDTLPIASVVRAGASGYEYGEFIELSALTDEQGLAPERPSYMNGTYFDEIYHARTGFEYLHRMPPLETSHPPLGKVFIMLSISVFGMTPFGWRFPGTLAGVLMIPAMYLLAKQLFKKTKWAGLAAALLSLDLMHLTQTRIATIDSYPVLFIMLMYWCMIRYFQMSLFRDGMKRTLPWLALSGVFMAGAIASKWIGLYASVGLAAILFWSFAQRFREYLHATNRNTEVSGEAFRLAHRFPAKMIGTIAWCVLWFVVIPAAVYAVSYIPDMRATGPFTLDRLISAQQSMYSYHSSLVDSHPFKSKWYEWPLDFRPMWYYSDTNITGGVVSTILAFGNPIIWWTGLAGLIATAAHWIRRRAAYRLDSVQTDSTPSLLLIGFLAEFLPWALVPRSMFIYHYFASVPFITLCLVWSLTRWEARSDAAARRVRVVRFALIGIAAAMFVGFYPFATGVEFPRTWANVMNWFGFIKMPEWPFKGWLFY
jgi:Gpi18-like mannosyltransferase